MRCRIILTDRTRVKKFRVNLVMGVIFTLILILAFRWIASGVMNQELNELDRSIYDFVIAYQSTMMNRIMVFISFLGSAYFLGAISIVAFWILMKIKEHYWDSTFVLFNLLGAAGLNRLLKLIYQRQRPDLEHLDKVTGYSFPSGHAMASFAFYGFMAYMVFLNIKDKRLRYSMMVVFILLAFAIGISRIYLGVHFASDVIGGFIGGGAWIATCIAAHQAIRYYKSI